MFFEYGVLWAQLSILFTFEPLIGSSRIVVMVVSLGIAQLNQGILLHCFVALARHGQACSTGSSQACSRVTSTKFTAFNGSELDGHVLSV